MNLLFKDSARLPGWAQEEHLSRSIGKSSSDAEERNAEETVQLVQNTS
jgi:hypothetical protein